jgi:hypothetical protein
MAASVQTERPKAPWGRALFGKSAGLGILTSERSLLVLRPGGLAAPEEDWLWQGKAGFGSRQGPLTGRGLTYVLWVLTWATDLAGPRWAFQVPSPAGRPPSRLAEVEELNGQPKARADYGTL